MAVLIKSSLNLIILKYVIFPPSRALLQFVFYLGVTIQEYNWVDKNSEQSGNISQLEDCEFETVGCWPSSSIIWIVSW